MAAEVLSALPGLAVDVHDAMPSVGRKFLMAGKGGMNITHSEPLPDFVGRYGRGPGRLPWLAAFSPTSCATGYTAWVSTPSSAPRAGFSHRDEGAPLLRAWLHACAARAWCISMSATAGWLVRVPVALPRPTASASFRRRAVILALGGGSWARLGSDGAWPVAARFRHRRGAAQTANCGFDVAWSPYFSERFAGQPVVKPVVASCAGQTRQGEFNITATGIEGGLVYALVVGPPARCPGARRPCCADLTWRRGAVSSAWPPTWPPARPRFAGQPPAPTGRYRRRQGRPCCVNCAR